MQAWQAGFQNRVIIYKSCRKKGVVDPADKLILGGRTEMKKLLVVFTAILVVAFAVPAFATDMRGLHDEMMATHSADAWSGEFTFGGITGFDKDKVNNAFGNLYADVFFMVDDYNKILWEFVSTVDTGGAGGAFMITAANLETDLGMALGLPVGLTTRAGLASIWTRKFEVTGHATERPVRPYMDGAGVFGSVDVGMAIIDLGIGFEIDPLGLAPEQDYAVFVQLPDIAGMLSAEAGYFITDNDDFKGQLTFNVQALDIADMIDAAASFTYDTAAAGGIGAEKWFWGLGVKGNVSMFGIGVGINGMEEAAVSNLTVDVNVAITDMFGVDVGVGLGLSDALDTFGGIDPSVYLTTGAATWRAGYLYQASDINGYLYTAPVAAAAAPDGSGLYISVDLDW
jgi:hypothetical protein